MFSKCLESDDEEVPGVLQALQKQSKTPVFEQPQAQTGPLLNFVKAKFGAKVHGMVSSYAANTHQGISRNYNEDRVTIIMNIARPNGKIHLGEWPLCSFFAVYDGHGGNLCADFLKDKLHSIVISHESFPHDPAQALTSGCLEAERLFTMTATARHPVHDHSGSCAIICLIVADQCYLANVGDSRAIMSADRGRKLLLLSRDHRPSEETEIARIVAAGG